MTAKRRQVLMLGLRFVGAITFATVLMVLLAAVDRAFLATLRLTLLIVPASTVFGFMPLLYWYRRDAYPIGLVFAPVTYFWLLCFARLTGLSY